MVTTATATASALEGAWATAMATVAMVDVTALAMEGGTAMQRQCNDASGNDD